MIPYRDENETQHRALVTGAIVVLNIASWLFVQGAGADSILGQSRSAISASFRVN